MDKKYYYNRAMAMFRNMVEENGFLNTPSKEDFKKFKKDDMKFLGLPIPRSLVESGDVSEVVKLFKNIEAVKSYYKGGVLLSISGYDTDSRELYEIKEVVSWIRKLLLEVPQAIYFINEESWSFIKSSISKEVKVLARNGEEMDMYEVSRRLQLGLPVTEYALLLTIEGHVLDNIEREIKRLGARINDLKGAIAIANNFTSTFKRVGE